MPIQYDNVVNKNFSKGEDSYSAKNNIQPGFTSTLRNVDVNSSGTLQTRKGYERYFGQLPIRVTKITHTNAAGGGANGLIRLTFDTSQTIDLSTTAVGPILVGGRLNNINIINSTLKSFDADSVGGDFSGTEQWHWYESYRLVNRQTLGEGAQTLSIAQASHGVSSSYIFVGLAESLETAGNTHSVVMPQSVEIDQSSYNIAIDYVGSTIPSTIEGHTYSGDGFFFFKEKSAVTGSTYIHSFTTTTSTTILAATHNLTNTNIGVRCFTTSGGVNTEVVPASLTINASGDITITFSSSTTGIAIITACPVANITTSTTLTLNAHNTIDIVNPGNHFCFYYIYARSGTTLTQVVPAAVIYDGDTDTASIRYYLGGTTEQVEIYWEEADSVANVIEIEDTDTTNVNTAYSDERPSMVVYGIPHDNIYKDETSKGGHVTHLDVYKSAGEERVIAGIGGNIYGAFTYEESGADTKMGDYFVHLRSRSTGISKCAPLFDVTGSSMERSRGLVTDASISSYKASVSTISYVSSGVMDVTLSFTALDNSITSGGEIDVNKDYLTIDNAGYAVNNGSFLITSIVSGGGLGDTSVVFRVSNSGCVSADTDETSSGAKAGVFTDVITLEDVTDFRIIGAKVTSSVLDADNTYTVVAYSTGDNEVWVDGVSEAVQVADGVLLFVGFTTNVLPIATSSGTAIVENYVPGDTVAITGYDRKFRIVAMNANADVTDASVTTSGGAATISIGASDIFNDGDSILIHSSAGTIPSGVYTIDTVASGVSITIDTSAVADGSTDSLTIVGKTLTLDETFYIEDTSSSVAVVVEGRWLPFEAPIPVGPQAPTSTAFGDLPGAIPSSTHISHFAESAYDDMPTVRSAMVNDSLFLTDGVNTIKKLDGANIIQAGLPYWQPTLFTAWDTSVEALLSPPSITGGDVHASASTISAGYYEIDVNPFHVGDRVYSSGTGEIHTVVESIFDSSTAHDHYHIYLTGDLTGAANGDTLTLVTPRKYYARLNYLDSNDNVIAGAATGLNDLIVEQTVAGRCKLRLVGLPDYGLYDYDKIEVELYRTVGLVYGAAETYYLVNRQLIPCANLVGAYIDITDDMADEELTTLDEVHGSLLGVERGISWDTPKVAKYITSSDNRLITANLSDDPVFDFQVFQPTGITSALDLSALSLLFRKDNTDTSTTSDMVNRMKYDTYPSGSGNIHLLKNTTTVSTKSSIDTGTDVITTTAPHGLTTGDAVRYDTAATNIGGLTAGVIYYVIVTGASTFKLAANIDNAVAGTQKDLTTNPAGTHTFTPVTGISLSTEIAARIHWPAHTLVAGTWVYLYHSAVRDDSDLSFAGWYMVQDVGTNYFYILGNFNGRSDLTEYDVDSLIYAEDAYSVPVFMGTDGNYRDRQGNVTSNTLDDAKNIFGRRLANAINASMRVPPRYWYFGGYNAYNDLLDFTPWLRARAGNGFKAGQVLVDVMQPLTTTAEVRVEAYDGTYQLFCNGRQVAADLEIPTDVGARTYLYPSRVAISFPNYPEITQRYVDINSADGQDITSIMPFFGESVFGAGNALSQNVAVFKTNSIYLLDVTTGEYVKVNSRGIGCTAPYSVAQTQNGIMFATTSGIYRLTHQMQVEYAGKWYEGMWKANVNKDALDVASGHYYPTAHQYKLAYPTSEDTNTNSYTAVYRQDDINDPTGSFTTYTNMPALMWANKGGDAFFASTNGLVMKLRNYGDEFDYRDDNAAVAEQIITLRADDFGIPGVRKVVASIITSLDLTTDLTSVIIEAATNLSSSFTNCGTVNLDVDEYGHATFRASPAVRKGGYFQVRLRHETIDECLIFTGIAFKVGRLDIQGTIETANLS